MNLFEFNKQHVHSRCRIWPGVYTQQIAAIIDPEKAVLIFGDNTIRTGSGGQAIIRSAECSVGIATKRYPACGPTSYFSDESVEDQLTIRRDLDELHLALYENPDLIAYFPEHGLGTGLSKMPTRCPKLFKEMNDVIYERFGIDYRIKE